MKVILKWEKPIMEYSWIKERYVPSKLDRENIFLSVSIKGLSSEDSYSFLDALEAKINEELGEEYGDTSFMRCTSYGEDKKDVLFDTCGWEREYGNVTKQKKKILKAVRNIVNQMIIER